MATVNINNKYIIVIIVIVIIIEIIIVIGVRLLHVLRRGQRDVGAGGRDNV